MINIADVIWSMSPSILQYHFGWTFFFSFLKVPSEGGSDEPEIDAEEMTDQEVFRNLEEHLSARPIEGRKVNAWFHSSKLIEYMRRP